MAIAFGQMVTALDKVALVLGKLPLEVGRTVFKLPVCRGLSIG